MMNHLIIEQRSIMTQKWKLNDPVFDLSGNGDFMSIGDTCEGIQVFGASGSGKSSGPMQLIAKSYLLNGFGGIVLCAKTDEAERWKKYLQKTKREKDMILLSESHFDFIKYEASRTTEVHIENIVNVFMQIVEISLKKESNNNDSYWERAGRQLLRNAITMLSLAKEDITLANLKKLVSSVPKELKDIGQLTWQKSSYCNLLRLKIEQYGIRKDRMIDYELADSYFFNEFPNLDSRTSSNVISFFTTLADGFLRGKIREIFCSGKIDFRPEYCLDGKILIVDLSIKEHGELGKYAAGILKYMVQQALERRTDLDKDTSRPVFIFADESHYFTTKYDQVFQTTARSARGCTVYATQNLPNYQVELKLNPLVKSLLGNLQTKIFCQNGDDETNKWASQSIGQEIVKRRGTSRPVRETFFSDNHRESVSTSEQKDFIISPNIFTDLDKGGKKSGFFVGSIIWQSGRKWKNKLPYINVKFKQKEQAIKYSNINSKAINFIIHFSAYSLLAILLYYIFNKELINIIHCIVDSIKGTNRYYIYAVLAGIVFMYIYILFRYTTYFVSILKFTFFLLLCTNAYYLFYYSTLNITAAFVINVYIILYFIYKMMKRTMNNSKWCTPYIILCN